MIWSNNKWRPGASLDAATATYLEELRNKKIVEIVFKIKREEGMVEDTYLINAQEQNYASSGGRNYRFSGYQMGHCFRMFHDHSGTPQHFKGSDTSADDNIQEAFQLNAQGDRDNKIKHEKISKDASQLNAQGGKDHPVKYENITKKMVKAKNRFVGYLRYTEPVVSDGHFSVPLSAITGNKGIDDLNAALAEIYTEISEMLQGFADELAVPGKKSCERVSSKKKISSLRTSGLVLRCQVKKLGGMPLGEPTAYWRFKFPAIPF